MINFPLSLSLPPSNPLVGAGRYNCTPSTRPGWDCGPPETSLGELAQGCLDDPQCLSMPIKQGAPAAAVGRQAAGRPGAPWLGSRLALLSA